MMWEGPVEGLDTRALHVTCSTLALWSVGSILLLYFCLE